MTVHSLHARVHCCCLLSCHCACNASADSAHWALHFASRSIVQTACTKYARPAVIAAFTSVLVAHEAVSPVRRSREPKRPAKAEGKTKGGGTCPPVTPVCTWSRDSTTRLCRRAAGSAKFAPEQAFPRASYDRVCHNLYRSFQG